MMKLAATAAILLVGATQAFDCYLRDIDYRSYGPDSGYSGVNTAHLKECTQLLLSNWPNAQNPNSQDPPLEAAGTVDLVRHFDDSLKVTWINLDYNDIGDVGAAVLSSALDRTTSINHVHLLNNGIGDTGAMALAAALTENENIIELNLRYNNIGDAGANALAEMIKTNRALRHLYLSNNSIGEKGMLALANAIGHNIVLKSVDIEDNPASDGENHKRIQELMEMDGSAKRDL